MKVKLNILYILLAFLWMPVCGWAQDLVDPGEEEGPGVAPVAKVGNTDYKTLKEAFGAAPANAQVDLQISLTQKEAVTANATTLNLNNLTLTGEEKAGFNTTGKLTVKKGTLKGAFTVTDLANFVAGTDVTLADNVKIISGGKSYYRVLIDLGAYTDATAPTRNKEEVIYSKVDDQTLCCWLEADQAAYPIILKGNGVGYQTVPVSIQAHGSNTLTLTPIEVPEEEKYSITWDEVTGGTLNVMIDDQEVQPGEYAANSLVTIKAIPAKGYTNPILYITRESEGTPIDITEQKSFILNDNVNILVTFKKSPTVGPDPENPDGNAPDIKILNPKQAFVYNGKPQAFTLTTSPENALEGATISYTLDGATVNEPTDAGIYDAIITRPADMDLAAVNCTLPGGLTIEKAEVFFKLNEGKTGFILNADAQTATLNAGDYHVYMLVDGKEVKVEGSFAWGEGQGTAINGNVLTIAESGIYEVVFTPTKVENYKEIAPITLPIELKEGDLKDKMRTVTVSVINTYNPADDDEVRIYNGNLLMATATLSNKAEVEFYEGQKPTFRAFPGEGCAFVKYLIGDEQINKQDYTPETFDVDLVVEGHFGEKGDLESLSPTFEAPKELVYNGQLYANSFRILQAKVYSNWIFNYTKNNKIVQPINVGEYTLVVSRPADSKYQAYTSEPMAFKITKATPTVVADEITGAYPGLELKDLKLSGTATVEGLGTIAGTFEWVEPATVIKEGENKVKFKFTPKDEVNINSVTDLELTITASKENIPDFVSVSYNKPLGGTLVVVYEEEGDNHFQVIPSGTKVPTGTKVRIFAYPADYFELASLTVNTEDVLKDLVNNKYVIVRELKVDTDIHANFRFTGEEPTDPDNPDNPDNPDLPDNWPDNWPGNGGGLGEQNKDYTILVRTTGLGSVTPGTTGANRGESITFKIEPGYGQQIVDVRVNGNSVGAVTSYQLRNIYAHTTVEAVFSNINVPVYTLTSKVINERIGYVTPTKVRVTEGSNHIFIVHPNKNRTIEDVQVGTEKELKSIGTPTSYIFTDVKADSLIVVTFHSPVANESIEASKYQIYTENGAVVVDPDHAAGTVNICDFSGRTIYSNREVRSITRFPLSEGSYIVTLIIDGKQYSQKVYLLSR